MNSLTFNFQIQALIVRANGISGPFKYSLVGEYLTVYVLSLNKTLGCFPSIKKYFSTGLFANTKLHTTRATPTPLNLFLMCLKDKPCFDFVQVCLLSNPQPLTVLPKRLRAHAHARLARGLTTPTVRWGTRQWRHRPACDGKSSERWWVSPKPIKISQFRVVASTGK